MISEPPPQKPTVQAPIGPITTGLSELVFVPEAVRSPNDETIRFRAEGALGSIGFSNQFVTLALPINLPSDSPPAVQRGDSASRTESATDDRVPFTVFRQRFDGIAPQQRITSGTLRPAVRNDVIGDKPDAWQTARMTYASIDYRQLYKGIDLRYEDAQGQLKSTYMVQPGSDPTVIRWRYEGIHTVAIDPVRGDLHLSIDAKLPADLVKAAGGRTSIAVSVTERAPVAWQAVDGKRTSIPVRFDLDPNGLVGFTVGAYDRSRPLTIDPILSYSTAFGGTGTQVVNDIVLHPDNVSVVVAGETTSLDFGYAQGQVGTIIGNRYAFVSKRSAGTGGEQWSTFFGGVMGSSFANSIAVLPNGNPIITGRTLSGQYPHVSTALPACSAGYNNLMVTTLAANSGIIAQSRCLGTTLIPRGNVGNGVAIASDGTIWVAGSTASGKFLSALPGASWTHGPDPVVSDYYHGFLAHLTSDVSSVLTQVYLGGTYNDEILDLALDSLDRPVVVGDTNYGPSGNGLFFAPSPNAYQNHSATSDLYDAFVTQLTVDGSGLRYSTLISGGGEEKATSVAVAADQIYVTGDTMRQDGNVAFPVTAATAWQMDYAGGWDAFVVKLDPSATGANSLIYGSLLGSSVEDRGQSIAARNGIASVAGFTASSALPLNAPLQAFGGYTDIFVAGLDTTTRAMPISSFLGGPYVDDRAAITADVAGNAYVGGTIGPSSIALDGASSTAITGQVLLDQVVTGLVPNTEYTLSAWVQAANGPDNPVWVWISEYGGATLFQGAVDTQGWEQLTHVFQTGPTNTRVRIRIQTPTLGGQALVDHVQLTGPLAPPPPDPPPGTMPGLLEAEDAPSFFDTDTINEGGAYRSDGLDVEACTVCLRTGSAGYSVGWTAAGEWLQFPVTFAASGSYKIRVRYTTPDTGQLLRVRLNGVDVTGQLALPQTGGWGNWQDVTSAAFSANAGATTIRIELLADMFNLDMIEIVPAGGN